MSNWQNEDGELLMTDAELRLEADLDSQSADERADEAWLNDEPDEWRSTCDETDHEAGDCTWTPEGDGEGLSTFALAEDAWLDGNYEE